VLLLRQDLSAAVKFQGCDADSSVTALKLENNTSPILMFNVNLPCDDNSAEYLNSLQQILGYIESCIVRHPDCKFYLKGNFNFECTMSNRGFREFSAFITEFDIVVCYDLDSQNHSYTYCHASIDHKSLIDHVFVHCDMITDKISNYQIISNGANLSDYSPVQFVLANKLQIFR
jgi:hypothetical protein